MTDSTNSLSSLQLINSANKELDALLRTDIRNTPDFQSKVLKIGQMVTDAAVQHDDLALASILHNQAVAEYPIRHCVDTAIVSMLVARRLKKTPDVIEAIVAAALTMNVGMHKEQYVFQAKQAPLTDAERQIIKAHPEEGVALLKAAGVTNTEWLNCVLMHHENEDGSGYPAGKRAMEITQNAKIIAIADRYCARVSSREYRKSLQPDAAVRDMMVQDKKNINPILAACFTKELGIYPIGTFVRLKTNEIGMVTGRGVAAATPVVHALRGTSGQILANPVMRDTAHPEYALDAVLTDGYETIKFSMQQIWGAAARI